MTNDNTPIRVPDPVLPKHRRSAFARVLGTLFALVFVVGVLVAVAATWAWTEYTGPGPLMDKKIINLEPGLGRTEIAQALQDQGIISDARLMNAASLANTLRGASLKPGEYEFQPHVSMAEVMNAIAAGRVVTYKLTVPEGWTSQMALARVNENDVLAGDPVSGVAEGAIMADTFVFRRGMTRQKLVEDMQSAQAKLVDEIWAKRPADSPLKTKEDMVTLASIVEKETAKPEERPRVAAVFLNRLKQGMRLQSDPTIIYGIVGGAGKLDRALTRADIDGKTPYNTYQISGLPPGPIANPGRAALEAVVAPAATNDLYFVADGTGGHAFAATLEEHNANVKRWREAQRNGIELPGTDQPAAAPADAPPAADIVQAPLPAVETPPADAGTAPATDQAPQPQDIPASQEEASGTANSGPPAPLPAEPPPLPALKKPKPAAPAAEPSVAAAADAPADASPQAAPAPAAVKLQPGTVVKLGERFVPIPVLKKKKP